jgi:hypothetical protein
VTKGKAKFRVVGSNDEALPSSVQFGAKAANSFSFGAIDACPPVQIEGKRVGDRPAKAAVVSAVYDVSGCV